MAKIFFQDVLGELVGFVHVYTPFLPGNNVVVRAVGEHLGRSEGGGGIYSRVRYDYGNRENFIGNREATKKLNVL